MTYHNIAETNNEIIYKSATIEEIEEYSQKVINNELECNLNNCPICNTKPSFYKRHAKRKRRLYILVNQLVEVVIAYFMRWKCTNCGKTFVQYPDFAIPFKRYTLLTILSYCKQYIENDELSYEKISSLTPIEYKVQNNELNTKELYHSTIHRWINTLGSYTKMISDSYSFLSEKYSSWNITKDFDIPKKKYRNDFQQIVLINCKKLLYLENIYKKKLGFSIFPNPATKYAFN